MVLDVVAVDVRVPAVAVAGVVVEGDKPDARLDQAAGDQGRLAEEVAAESGYGHAAAEYAVELAHRAGAKRVMLFHHKPDRTDEQLDELAARFAGDAKVALAREGEVVDL